MPRFSVRLLIAHSLLCAGILASACTPASSGNTPAGPPASQPGTAAKTSQVSPPAPAAPSDSLRPATLLEATAAIDLRTFPMLKHGNVFYKTAAKVGYALADAGLKDAVDFYREKLIGAGWKIEADKTDPAISYGSIEATKSGFHLSVSIVKNPNSSAMHAFVENQGNVDARSLPRYPGAEPEQAYFHIANYEANAKMEDVAKHVVEELKKRGWRPAAYYGGRTGSVEGVSIHRYFMQGGIYLNVTVENEEGKSALRYHPHLLKYAVPVPPEVTTSVDMSEDPVLRVFYMVRIPAREVLAFYRRELPLMGWTIPEAAIKDGKAEIPLQGPEKEPLLLELEEKDGHTLVQIAPPGKRS